MLRLAGNKEHMKTIKRYEVVGKTKIANKELVKETETKTNQTAVLKHLNTK